MSDELIPKGPRPQIDDNAWVDRIAMNAVERLFLEHGSHQLEVPSRDLGRDGRLIFRFEDGGAAGYSTSLQVKGTRTRSTEGKKAFVWPVPRKTLVYLSDCQAPAYFVFHNCVSGKTYVREVHEFCSYLDVCHPDWRDDTPAHVNMLVQVDISLLDEKKIKHIADEARAWAMERQSTKKLVEHLEKDSANIGFVVAETQGDTKRWRLSGGGFRLREAGAKLSTRDAITAFLLGASVGHAQYLCNLYWTRQSKAMMPHELINTSRGGVLDLTATSLQLQDAADTHKQWLDHAKHLEWLPPAESSGRAHADELPQHAPLTLPDHHPMSAEDAAKSVHKYLSSLGLQVVRSTDEPLDLIVRCGNTKGLLSFAVFGNRATRERIQSVRPRLNAASAEVGAILIKFTQTDELKLHLWEEPASQKMPPIPFGTDAPTLDDFLTKLLARSIEASDWNKLPDTGADLPPPGNGYSAKMPSGIAPDSTDADAYQQAVARRHAAVALASVKSYRPIYFVFHWQLRRIEVYVMTSPADLTVFVLNGPRKFFESGGHTMLSSDAAPPS